MTLTARGAPRLWHTAMLAGAVAAQLLDLATMDPSRELNPIALHPLGMAAKLLLCLVLVAGHYAVGARWTPVLLLALGVGSIGAWSNVR